MVEEVLPRCDGGVTHPTSLVLHTVLFYFYPSLICTQLHLPLGAFYNTPNLSFTLTPPLLKHPKTNSNSTPPKKTTLTTTLRPRPHGNYFFVKTHTSCAFGPTVQTKLAFSVAENTLFWTQVSGWIKTALCIFVFVFVRTPNTETMTSSPPPSSRRET